MALLKKQYWMVDDVEYEHVKNKVNILSELTQKRKNHIYVDEFLKEWNVIFARGTYALEGEIDDKTKDFKRQMDNFLTALKYIQNINGRLTPEEIKTVHKLVMMGEKHKNGEHVLIGEYRKTPVFAGYHEFVPFSVIPKMVTDALDRYYSKKSNDPILNAVKLFIDLINIHPFEDGNGRTCRLIISHVLMKSGLSLFPVLISSFHRRERRHYIQAVKRFEYCPSMFYTMVCLSLVHVWENFEQNLALMEKSEHI